MSMFDDWYEYTLGLSAPQSYIDWGGRFIIASALQRRVWMPPKHKPIYANMYINLVGRAGLGKGIVLEAIDGILRHNKLEMKRKTSPHAKTEDEKAVYAVFTEKELKAAEEADKMRGSGVGKLTLIPMAPNATTYEALVNHMAKSIRYADYSESGMLKVYCHTSMCFCLDELASLFRSNKNTADVVNFLLQTYDCRETYEHLTKTQQGDRITRVCMNFIAGMTPDFMQKTFDAGFMSQGYASRTFFIYATHDRSSTFFIPGLTPEQEAAKERVVNHVLELTKLYGEVILEPKTVEFIENWWADYVKFPHKKASQSSKLEEYYARKKLHLRKVAMAQHFGQSLDMCIPIARFEDAIEILHEEEKHMELALTMGGDNKLFKTSVKVMQFLEANKRATYDTLLLEFYKDAKDAELTEIMNFLQKTDQVKSKTEEDEHTKVQAIYYRIKE